MNQLVYHIFIAVGYVYYLQLGTSNSKLVYPIGVFFGTSSILIGLVLTELITWNGVDYIVFLCSIIGCLFYTYRYWKKTNKYDFLEVIKLLAVFQLTVIYCINWTNIPTAQFILALVYFVARFNQIENIGNMTRNVVSGFLILVCVFFVVFATIKANEAEKQTMLMNMSNNLNKEKLKELSKQIDNLTKETATLKIDLRKCQSQD
ncbi:MAG: hypothetical protein ABJH98_02500 [Reichenbachiella sp.]|uniref:hypothetical protein n=1 Tax=Reichenbachiella sp. TaxID=2184521 RepID=UPI0032994677